MQNSQGRSHRHRSNNYRYGNSQQNHQQAQYPRFPNQGYLDYQSPLMNSMNYSTYYNPVPQNGYWNRNGHYDQSYQYSGNYDASTYSNNYLPGNMPINQYGIPAHNVPDLYSPKRLQDCEYGMRNSVESDLSQHTVDSNRAEGVNFTHSYHTREYGKNDKLQYRHCYKNRDMNKSGNYNYSHEFSQNSVDDESVTWLQNSQRDEFTVTSGPSFWSHEEMYKQSITHSRSTSQDRDECDAETSVLSDMDYPGIEKWETMGNSPSNSRNDWQKKQGIESWNFADNSVCKEKKEIISSSFANFDYPGKRQGIGNQSTGETSIDKDSKRQIESTCSLENVDYPGKKQGIGNWTKMECAVGKDSNVDRTASPSRLIENWDYPGKKQGIGNWNENINFNTEAESKPKSIMQKLMEISNTPAETNESDDDTTESMCSDKELNVNKSDKQSDPQSITLQNALEILSQQEVLALLNKILDFFKDESATTLIFDDFKSNAEGCIIKNIKNKSKLLKKLSSRCLTIYKMLLQVFSQCKFKITCQGQTVKTYEYTKLPSKFKRINPEDFDVNNPNNKSLQDFSEESLLRILHFIEDDSEASLCFNNIFDRDKTRFLLKLKNVNCKRELNGDSQEVYRRIIQIIKERKDKFQLHITCKDIAKRRFITYHKVPPGCDLSSLGSDPEGTQPRGQVKKRSRGRTRDHSKESVDREKGKKDSTIGFLPQTESEDTPQERQPMKEVIPGRVNKEKAKILEGLAKPVTSSKAERMMAMMGWKGGALGSKGDGIVEPIAPNLLQVGQAGLGHVRDSSPRGRQRGRHEDRPAAAARRPDDFVVGTWVPVPPAKLTKKQLKALNRANNSKPATKNERRKMAQAMQGSRKDAVKMTALKSLLAFVSDDRLLELPFDKSLNGKQRKMIHQIVTSFSDESEDPELDNSEQCSLYEKIVNLMDCVLYTESQGDNKKGTRQLFVYKTVSEDTFLITPDELEEEVEKEDKGEAEVNVVEESNTPAVKTNTITQQNPKEIKIKKPKTYDLCMVTENNQLSGITIDSKFLEKKTVAECPDICLCQRFFLCKRYIVGDTKTKCDDIKTNSDDVKINSDDVKTNDTIIDCEESDSSEKSERPVRKRLCRNEKAHHTDNKTKTIKLPKPENWKTNHERIVRLLVECFEEFYYDKEALKLRFLGDFKVIDRISMNSFMSELNEISKKSDIDRLKKIYSNNEDIFIKLKKMIFDGPEIMEIHRNDEGPFSTYTITKTISLD